MNIIKVKIKRAWKVGPLETKMAEVELTHRPFPFFRKHVIETTLTPDHLFAKSWMEIDKNVEYYMPYLEVQWQKVYDEANEE